MFAREARTLQVCTLPDLRHTDLLGRADQPLPRHAAQKVPGAARAHPESFPKFALGSRTAQLVEDKLASGGDSGCFGSANRFQGLVVHIGIRPTPAF